MARVPSLCSGVWLGGERLGKGDRIATLAAGVKQGLHAAGLPDLGSGRDLHHGGHEAGGRRLFAAAGQVDEGHAESLRRTAAAGQQHDQILNRQLLKRSAGAVWSRACAVGGDARLLTEERCGLVDLFTQAAGEEMPRGLGDVGERAVAGIAEFLWQPVGVERQVETLAEHFSVAADPGKP